jgi:hypothetical protein
VHPLDWDPVGERSGERSLIAGIPVDAALGKVDYYEAVGFSDHLASSRFWYRLLNCGFRIPAGAGTDESPLRVFRWVKYNRIAAVSPPYPDSDHLRRP